QVAVVNGIEGATHDTDPASTRHVRSLTSRTAPARAAGGARRGAGRRPPDSTGPRGSVRPVAAGGPPTGRTLPRTRAPRARMPVGRAAPAGMTQFRHPISRALADRGTGRPSPVATSPAVLHDRRRLGARRPVEVRPSRARTPVGRTALGSMTRFESVVGHGSGATTSPLVASLTRMASTGQ